MNKFRNPIKKINASVLIALIAVLISSFSAFISLKETRILNEQQQIMNSQKEASVWPYLENSFTISKQNDSVYRIEYSTVNKGVGPAIINSVEYRFRGNVFKNWEFVKILRSLYPNLKFESLANAPLDDSVLSVGEEIIVYRILIHNQKEFNANEFNILVNQIAVDINLKYCYCSVYGSCWQVDGQKINRSTKCKFRQEIR